MLWCLLKCVCVGVGGYSWIYFGLGLIISHSIVGQARFIIACMGISSEILTAVGNYNYY